MPVIDGPLFSYFGAKWTLGAKLPGPLHRTIVEPFAGSACYALRHPERDVVLVERDPHVARVWRYLLAATPDEIRALPDLEDDQDVADLEVSDGARTLIGFWLNAGSTGPKRRKSTWAKLGPGYETGGGMLVWGEAVRSRIAAAVSRIRHWTLIEGDYREAPDVSATWFVDPPYQIAGRRYRCSSDAIDFDELGAWCRSRRGQIIACENVGASWLPFRPFGNERPTSTRKRHVEAVWFGGDGQLGLEGFER